MHAKTGRALRFKLATFAIVVIVFALATPAFAYALGEIHGTVTDADTGVELPDMQVSLYQWDTGLGDWSWFSDAYTDTSGYYVFDGLASGQYAVQVPDWSGTYIEQWYNNQPDATTATHITISTATVFTANFAMAKPPHGTISGRVVEDAFHDPLVGITVNAYRYDSSDPTFMDWVGSTETIDDGTYALDVPVGQIVLEYSDYRYVREYTPEFYNNTTSWSSATKLTVTDGSTTTGINAGLAEGGHVTGTVTDLATGEPLASVRVVAFAPPYGEEMMYEAFTRTDGTFEIGGLPTNTYKVGFFDIGWTDPSGHKVYVDQYYNGVSSLTAATAFSVTQPATVSGINGALRRGNSISGKVTESGTGEVIYQPDMGQGMSVELYDSLGNQVEWKMTDENGEYVFGGLPNGSYKVKFYDWGYDVLGDPGNQFYVTQWYNNRSSQALADWVSVSGPTDRTGVNASMVSNGTWGTISGTVEDLYSAGRKIPAPAITLFAQFDDNMGGTYWAPSCDVPQTYGKTDGTYKLKWVPAGTYRIMAGGFYDESTGDTYAQMNGFTPVYYVTATDLSSATNISLAGNEKKTGINFALFRSPGTIDLRGYVRDETTLSSIAGVPFKIERYVDDPVGAYWEWWGETVSNTDGYFTYPCTPGTYRVGLNIAWGSFAQHQGYVEQWYAGASTPESATPVVVGVAGPTTISPFLVSATPISGNVSGPDGVLENATVTAYRWDGAYWTEATYAHTNASGNYTLGTLKAPDTYHLMFDPPWPNADRLAAEGYNNRPNVDYAQNTNLTYGVPLTGVNAVLAPGNEFRGRVFLDGSDADVGQSIKVHAWFNDPTDGWIEVQSTYAYSSGDGEWWLSPMMSGQYRFGFDDPGYGYFSPLYYSNKVSFGAANSLAPAGGSLSVLLQTMDGTPPSTTTDALGGYTTSATIHLTAADTVSGVKATHYSLDGGPDTVGTTVSTSVLGWHELTYYSVDNLDNAESARTVMFEVLEAGVYEPVPVAGETRIDTAIQAAEMAYPSGASTVVIATAYNWPDALGGAALAGAYDGPILLTKPDDLPTAVANAIDGLGASKAVILGGTAAVNTAVETELKTMLGTSSVTRISGADRYETARKIAAKTVELLGTDFDGKAFVATGGKFPDALGASPLAAAKSWPIFLIDPTKGFTSATKTAMEDAGVTDALILGGTAVVSADVEDDLKEEFGTARVERLAGADRYETSCIVADYGVTHAGLFWNRVAIATGQNFPDALAGGVLQGRDGSVMLLTESDSLNSDVQAKLVAKKSQISEVRYLGGLNAVSQAVRNAVATAIQ